MMASFIASMMTYKCIGCKKIFEHKIGLSNHQHTCFQWKNYDAVTLHKRRRLEQQQQAETQVVQADLAVQPADDNLTMEVCFYLHFSWT